MSDVKIVQRLPLFPSQGDEVDLLVDPQALYGGPHLWRCRFRKATPDPYKWHVLDGPPLAIVKGYGEDSVGPSNTLTFVALTSPPAIVVPAAGIYDCDIGGRGHQNSDATWRDILLSPQFGSTTARDVDALTANVNNSRWDSQQWRRGVRGVVPAAGQSITLMHRCTSACNAYWQSRSLLVRGVRLGPG